jgi:hypothetical protein
MKDFSRVRKPVEFVIDGDQFDCMQAIPAETLLEITTEFEKLDETEDSAQMMAAMKSVLRKFLLPRSCEKFLGRMGDPEHPIELPQVNEVLMWLMEQYGLRPTKQSSESADGLPDLAPGTSSTGTTPVVESISLPSPLIGSST